MLTTFKNRYAAIFYDHVMVLAVIEKKQYRSLNKEIKAQIKRLKIPIMQRSDYHKQKRNEFLETYLIKSHEQAICENANNFEIRYCDIEEVKLSPYKTHSTREYQEGKVLGQLWINIYHKKYHFNHEYEKQHIKVNKIKKQFADKFVLLK